MKTKWLIYVKQMNLYQPGLAVFSEWLNDIADVQDELLLYSNLNADRAKTSYKEKSEGSTFATSATNTANDNSKTRECVERRQTSNLEMRKVQEDERRRKRTKGERTEAVLQSLSNAHHMR